MAQNFLDNCEYTIREELVLKIAILAEKHVTEYQWCVGGKGVRTCQIAYLLAYLPAPPQ